jgi:hypothetical protein
MPHLSPIPNRPRIVLRGHFIQPVTLESLCENPDLSRWSLTAGLKMKDFGAQRAPLQHISKGFYAESDGSSQN